MVSILTDIFHGIESVPYLILALLVESINGWIMVFGGFASLVVGLLPGFPEPPELPGDIGPWLNWFYPLTAVLGVFSLLLVTYIAFLAYKVALNWGKVNM